MGRFYFVPTLTFVNGEYDTHGEYTETPDQQGNLTLFSMAFALEYGINEWITAGIQWSPGLILSTSSDIPTH